MNFYKLLLLSSLAILYINVKAQDSTTMVSAFFGLDNDIPLVANAICPGVSGMDGMPVNFNYSIDVSTLSPLDFEVMDSLGNRHTPMCARLVPANENGENRTVLLFGEFGTAGTNPPVVVRIIDDLYTLDKLPDASACSEVKNLKGSHTTNVVPLIAGPSMFFAQRINGSIDECVVEATQTIQVAWDGGVSPHLTGDTEEDLVQYYIGYTDSAGALLPHFPMSIADINDNDNFHQLCFATVDPIFKLSVIQGVVEDPNGDPNLHHEIAVRYCSATTVGVLDYASEPRFKVFPNPFSEALYTEHLKGNEYFCLYHSSGQIVFEGKDLKLLNGKELTTGLYFLTIQSNSQTQSLKLIKK